MSLQLGYFIADGVFHEDLPGAFSQITDEAFGVPTEIMRVAEGKKIISVQGMGIPDTDDYRDYFHRRKIAVQAWRADWNEDSIMPNSMFEHLNGLYETQKKFWIQYDDEMSRCWGRLIGFESDLNDGNSPHVYFTPHYPIFPFGHEPPDDPEAVGAWDNNVWVANGVYTGDYTVYPDYGLVLLDAASTRFNERIKAHLKYTWRAYVRVKELQLQPLELAQTYYTGSIIFEQVAIPVSGVPLVWRDAPYVGTCTVFARVRTSSFAKIAIAAVANAIKVGEIQRGQAISVVAAKAFVNATKTSVAQKYGSTGISPIRINALSSVAATVVASTVQQKGLNGEHGNGWGRSTKTKFAYQILSDNDPNTYIYGSTFSQRFTVEEPDDPTINTGHALKVTWRRGLSEDTTLAVRLLEGERLIATGTFNRTTDDDALDSYSLTAGEAGAITDYSELRIEFYADNLAIITGFTFELPINGGVVIKTRSVFAQLNSSAEAHATRPVITGYPVLATIGGRMVVVASKQGETSPGGDLGG